MIYTGPLKLATAAVAFALVVAPVGGSALAKDQSEHKSQSQSSGNKAQGRDDNKKPTKTAVEPKAKGKQATTKTGPPRDATPAKDSAAPDKPSGPATGTTPAPSPTVGGKVNAEISGVPVGPGRPADTGGGTIKTGAGTAPPSPPPTKGESAPAAGSAFTPSPAALDDDAATKRATSTPLAAAKPKLAEPKPAAAAAPPAAAARALAAPSSAAAVATPAVAAGVAAAAAAVYSHNSSTMKLVPEGDAIRLVYDKPRPGLEPLGIAPGTPLFEGKKTGPNAYAGEATTFSKACGAAKFPVAGDDQGGTVTLRGQKPLRDGKCNVTGYTSETLVFEKGKN